MKEKDREPGKSGGPEEVSGDHETGRGQGPEDPTAAWDPDQTLSAPAPAEPPPPSGRQPGETFGSFRLEAPLGRGGFGEVWEAVHTESGRRVALKLLTTQGETTPEARERFHREARLAASVSHPHCVFLFGAEEVDGRMAVAMELMEGGTLQELLDAEGRLPYRRAVDVILDLVEGLEAAHEKGIIHRDIKPSNCFLDGSGGVKIGDFGLSKTLEADDALTVTGTYLGTPAYSSPEQVRGREIDFRSDVFSLGALLYHLVTGERPFGSGPATHVLGRILSEDPDLPSEHGAEVPKGLEKVIRKMMAKEPGERYSSYEALRRALLPFSTQGLGPAALPKRFGAYLLDVLILTVPGTIAGVAIGGFQMFTDPEWALQPEIQILGSALSFVYFFLLEGLWRASLGKRLVGLRVLSAGGNPAGWRQVLIRTGVFVGFPLLLGLLTRHDQALYYLASFGSIPALFITLRKRNGYAGIHELLSGTRVMTLPAARGEVAAAVREPAGREADLPGGARRFGPYRVVQRLWAREAEELYEALDPLLERRVWIHVVEQRDREPTNPSREPGTLRPARLQWLQGRTEEEGRWDAYERPDGWPLLAWVERGTTTDWPEALVLVRNLARALAEDLQGTSRRSLAEIWIEPGGRVRLLPFRWRADVEDDEEVAGRPLEGHQVLHGSFSVFTEGRLPCDAGTRIDRPLPRSARALLDRLAGGEELTLEEAVSELDRLVQRGGRLSRLQRAGALAPAAFLFTMLIAASLGALVAGHSEPASPRRELPERLRQWHALEGAAGSEIEGRREALAGLLVQGYLEAQTERSEEDLEHVRSSSLPHRLFAHYLPNFLFRGSFAEPTGPYGFPRGVSAEDQTLLSRLASDRKELEPEEVEELRAVAGPTWTSWWVALSVPSPFQMTVAVLAILCAALLRGGVGFRLALVEVQRRDGNLAGRGRCALRALIAWSPLVAPWVLWIYLESHHPLPALLAAAAPILLLFGALYAVWHPTRGIQDRLAGTWLMPR